MTSWKQILLQEILLDFTVNYLVEQPPDIIYFAMEYFTNLHQKRTATRGPFPHSDDESMVTDDDDDIIGKCCSVQLHVPYYPAY